MVTKAEWTERVKRWGKSGLGREEFAEGEGIDAKRLTWWRWKLRTEAVAAPTREPVRFLPVRVVGEAMVTTVVADQMTHERRAGCACGDGIEREDEQDAHEGPGPRRSRR